MMLNRFAAATALCLTLGIGPALAQQTAPQQPSGAAQTNEPGTAQGTQTGGHSVTVPTQPGPGAASAGTTTVGQLQVITRQQPGQWLVDDLTGKNVYNMNDENIGSISDVLVDQNGRVTAAIIGVGGFLGLGQRDVAIPIEQIQVRRGAAATGATDADRAGHPAPGTTAGGGVTPSGAAPADAAATGTDTTGSVGGTTAGAGTGGLRLGHADLGDRDVRLVVATTREDLRNLPAFVKLDDRQRGGTGAATGGQDRPAVGGPGAAPGAAPGSGTQRTQ